MLTIRLRRTGKKRQPSFRIVVTDSRASIYGQYIEMLGAYNPITKVVVLDDKKTLDWLNNGAQPSNTVSKILQKQGLKHKSIRIHQYRAVSQKELEAQKAKEEAERAKIQAEKEAAKVAFEEQVKVEKEAHPTSEEKLQEVADDSIKVEKGKEEKMTSQKEAQETENKEDKEPEKETKSDALP